MTSPEPNRPLCPSCGAAVTWADNPARPFCSLRCKLVDLGAWLDQNYRVPGDPITPVATSDRASPPAEE